jgi:hypothetical protein
MLDRAPLRTSERAVALRERPSPWSDATVLSQCLPAAEDIRGPSGYFEFVHAATDPSNREHADMLRWTGRAFDPARSISTP